MPKTFKKCLTCEIRSTCEACGSKIAVYHELCEHGDVSMTYLHCQDCETVTHVYSDGTEAGFGGTWAETPWTDPGAIVKVAI